MSKDRRFKFIVKEEETGDTYRDLKENTRTRTELRTAGHFDRQTSLNVRSTYSLLFSNKPIQLFVQSTTFTHKVKTKRPILSGKKFTKFINV